nr:hypothetical protein [Tanacetum cinerariifolium]
MGEAAPKPKACARKKKGNSTSSTTPPTPTPTTTVESTPRLSTTAKGKQPSRATTLIDPTDVQRIEAEQLKIVLKRSRQETQISQQRSSGTNEGTGSKPGVPDTGKGGDEVRESKGESDEVRESKGESDEEETRQEEDKIFDPIPRTPEESEEESNDEKEQDLRLSEEARIQEKEDADELYPFRFEERLRSLETSFSEYRQTNPFADDVSAIPGIVH